MLNEQLHMTMKILNSNYKKQYLLTEALVIMTYSSSKNRKLGRSYIMGSSPTMGLLDDYGILGIFHEIILKYFPVKT